MRQILRCVCWGFGLVLMAASALAKPAPHAQTDLIAQYAIAPHGEKIWVALRLQIEPGWHVYWRNPGDSGLPPQLRPEAPYAEPDFVWPMPHTINLGTLTDYGYEHTLVLPFRLTMPETGDNLAFRAKADWLICKDICIPEQADLRLDLPLAANGQIHAEQAALIHQTLEAAPKPFTGTAHTSLHQDGYYLSVIDPDIAYAVKTAASVRFFPYQNVISNHAPQRAHYGEAGLRLLLSYKTPNAGQSLNGVLVLEDRQGHRRGWEIHAPFGPVLSGTHRQAFISNSSNIAVPEQSSALATPNSGVLAMLLFILAGFAGGLLLNLMPCVFPVLAVKAAQLIATTEVKQAQARPQALAYMAGMVICFGLTGLSLIALRAAGEAVGLGFHLQYPFMTAILCLIVTLIGLSLLGLIAVPGLSVAQDGEADTDQTGQQALRRSFWTGALAALIGAPCVGPFMAAALAAVVTQSAPIILLVFVAMGFGMALPVTAIGLIPAWAAYLPRPGAWMQSLQKILSLPMFATALWLAWVLAGQRGDQAALFLVGAMIVLGLGLWIHTRVRPARIAQIAGWSGACLALLLSALAVWGPSLERSRLDKIHSVKAREAEWSPEQLAWVRAQGHPVLVDFTARWCLTCQFNTRTVLQSPDMQALMAQKGVWLLTADWTNRDAAIGAELARYGRAGVPLYLYFAPGQDTPQILPQILTRAGLRQTLNTSGEGSDTGP